MIPMIASARHFPIQPLGSVVEFLDHLRRPVKAVERSEGDYPYYGANGQQGTIDGYIFDEPLILLAEDGGHFDNPERGIAYRISGKTWVNNHAHALRPRENVDIGFLCRMLENRDVTQFITGSTRAKLTKAGASQIPIPIPPLDEQCRIAQVLDSVDALSSQRRKTIALLDDLARFIFLDMFGNPVSNNRDWPVLPFGEVCQTRLGKMLDARAQTGLHLRPYLRNANVQWFRINTSGLLQMDFNEDDRQVFSLAPGDVLICEGGEPGRAAIWRGELQECYFQKALHRARPREGVALPDYVVHLLWFYSKRGGFNGHVSAATIAHLTGEKLRKMPVPVPPIDAQRHFSQRIQSIDSLKLSHKAGLAKLDALFATLQHHAFRGELWNHAAA